MAERDNGGPAFPGIGEAFITGPNGDVGPQSMWGMQGSAGMSLRDWFAGQLAAAEVASAGANWDAAKALAEAAQEAGQTIEQRIAFDAYSIADAMLLERCK